MKTLAMTLLFAAFTLSLVITVSAQQGCDLDKILNCTSTFADMITNTDDPVALLRLTQEYCRSDCVTTAFPACSSLSPQVAASVDQINKECQRARARGGASSTVYSSVVLLLSITLAGLAALFY